MTEGRLPALELENLIVGYGGAPVVRGLTMTVEPGEVVALLGANGAGKTTTLRAISGLVKPTQGSIRLAGEEIGRLAANHRHRVGRVAHVPEGRGIFAGLTVAEHLRLGRHGERLQDDLVYSYFPALVKLKARRAGLLSGGEQQMLAIGRALARSPQLLLLDELSLGLAPIIVEKLLPVIQAYARESSCGVLLVEQHISLALEIADRGYVLARGEVTLEGRAEQLRRDQERMTATYLGERPR
jgi:branched-chain amino acid transport system ATP-binding protein